MKPPMQASGSFRFRDIPRALWFFLDEDRWRYLVFLFVLLAVMFYTMVPPLLIGIIANSLIDFVRVPGVSTGSWEAILGLVGILAGSYAVVAMIRLSSKRILGKISLNARYRAKVWGFDRLLGYSLAWHQEESTGNKAQRILTGAESVREWTGDMVNQLTQGLAAFTGSLIACLFLHPAFILFFLYYIGVLGLIEGHFDRKISRLSDTINKSMEDASGTFIEGASNILAVKALGARKDVTNSVEARENKARNLSWERLRMSNRKWMCFQLHNASAWAVYLVVIALMVMDGKLLPGFFLTYAAYWDRLRESAVEFTDRVQLMIERKSNLGRMMGIFRGTNTLVQGNEEFPRNWKRIVFEDACLAYGERQVLGPLNLSIGRGEVIGIAGASGSGKSSIIKLLLGLYHASQGSVRIDGTDLSQIRHEALTRDLAVVLQETELFNFSLRDNITMLRDLDENDLEKACSLASLDGVIERLPEGLDSLVGEKGYTLSGGERQRVGIARALCRNASLLLLDEASSALDSRTEEEIAGSLRDLKQGGLTMLVVAHRLSTLRFVDRILVMDQGLIAEEGSFEELIHQDGSMFRALFAQQQGSDHGNHASGG